MDGRSRVDVADLSVIELHSAMEEFFRPAWEVFAKEPTVSDTSWQPTLGFPFLHATFSHFELREFPSLYAWCVFSQGIHGDFVFLVILQYIFCQFLLLIVAAFFLYCRDTFCHTPLLYFIFYIFFIITTPYMYIHTYIQVGIWEVPAW